MRFSSPQADAPGEEGLASPGAKRRLQSLRPFPEKTPPTANSKLLMGIEPMTSSLPRKRSTPELQEPCSNQRPRLAPPLRLPESAGAGETWYNFGGAPLQTPTKIPRQTTVGPGASEIVASCSPLSKTKVIFRQRPASPGTSATTLSTMRSTRVARPVASSTSTSTPRNSTSPFAR
jgi:hypothetical protein